MALATEPPPELPKTTDDLDGAEVDEAYIRFRATGIKIEDPPSEDDTITLIVKGTCTGEHKDTMKDGEKKHTRVIEVESVYERGKVPIVDEGPKGLFDFVSDQRLWETAKDAAFERGEVLDDVVTGWLRDYINAEPEDDNTTARADDVDTKTDGGQVIRPAFSDQKKDD